MNEKCVVNPVCSSCGTPMEQNISPGDFNFWCPKCQQGNHWKDQLNELPQWIGDDLKECLETVENTRFPAEW